MAGGLPPGLTFGVCPEACGPNDEIYAIVYQSCPCDGASDLQACGCFGDGFAYYIDVIDLGPAYDGDGNYLCPGANESLSQALAGAQGSGTVFYGWQIMCGVPNTLCPGGLVEINGGQNCVPSPTGNPTPPGNPSLPPCNCAGGVASNAPCIGSCLDPPLPMASDGVGFSMPSNVALPVHPTVSAERVRETCGVCGDDGSDDEEFDV